LENGAENENGAIFALSRVMGRGKKW